jgi:hypothetical protein
MPIPMQMTSKLLHKQASQPANSLLSKHASQSRNATMTRLVLQNQKFNTKKTANSQKKKGGAKKVSIFL